MFDLARRGPNGERLCPRCGERVAEQAMRCFMCAAPLRGALPAQRLPWSEVLVFILIVGVGLIWYSRTSAGSAGESALAEATSRRALARVTSTEEGTAPPGTRASVPSPTLSPSVTPTETPTLTATPTYYEVRQGDSIIFIAGQFGTTVDAIMAANNLSNPNFLSVGKRLLIPQPGSAAPPARGVTSTPEGPDIGQGVNYRVKPGDTLQQLSAQFKVPVDQILATNVITDPNNLPPGKVLVLTRATVTPTPNPTVRLQVTPTALAILPAPHLLGPAQDAHLSDDIVDLEWGAVSTLDPDQWYAVRIWETGTGVDREPRTYSARTQMTSLKVPREWQPTGGDARRYRWSVLVVKDDQDGLPVAVSTPSEIREFTWVAK